MKELSLYLIDAVFGAAVGGYIIWTIWAKKLKESKYQTGRYIEKFLCSLRPSTPTNLSDCAVYRLYVLKNDYLNTGGSLDTLSELARNYIHKVVLEQTDIVDLWTIIGSFNSGLRDKWVDTVINEAFIRKECQNHIIALYEKRFASIKTMHQMRGFTSEINGRYFRDTDVYPHFFSRIADFKEVA